ncbi:MAG: UvrD-helicase domain-containing protein [Pseudomonadota bacterium]
MKFIADLHVHSHFSRATAKNLNLENMYIAAHLKGITVVGTGDFTHPGWFAELKEKLVPAEEGLFKLKDEIAERCDKQIPKLCRRSVRFLLVSEISNIYKKNQKTRKNHNLVYMPGLDTAEKFNSKLARIGNIKSDGRPILGLDVKDLLEIILETSDRAFLIPAHIWTPWFSLLGSKSGFDSIEECFEDLTPFVFAVETGLSSDPSMNWRVSGLDGLTLVSNSDAHSPLKLGREANIFNTELSYPAIKSAIQTGDSDRFMGTIEFYPEEGKYHLDGHRKCNIRLRPEKTRALSGKCPACGSPLTQGVLYRVEELADRPGGEKPAKYHPFYHLIPLTEILSETLRVGPGTKKVMEYYRILLDKLGPEIEILKTLSIETIEKVGGPLLGEAVARMRRSEIVIQPGYDGEFGTIKIFDKNEREKLLGQKTLFVQSKPESLIQIKIEYKKEIADEKIHTPIKTIPIKTSSKSYENYFKTSTTATTPKLYMDKMNPEQRRAVEHQGGPLIIVAGPGTGKTLTLTHRIAHLVTRNFVSPRNILAVTFTNKAAREMRHRLKRLMPDATQLPFMGTFHGLCLKLLNDYLEKQPIIIDDNDRKSIISDAIKLAEQSGIRALVKPQKVLDWIISAKQKIIEPYDKPEDIPDPEKRIFAATYKLYQKLLSIQNLYDYEDLVVKTVRLFENDARFTKTYRDIYKYIFVDEYQDLNYGQYCIIRALAPPGAARRNLCVIGDPDQSIYGFRGSDVKYFKTFMDDYPDAEVVNLKRNYRSTQTILKASYQVVSPRNKKAPASRIYSDFNGVKTIGVLETVTEKAEAVAVGRTIEQMVGGMGFYSIDFGKLAEQHQSPPRGFSDFAVLYRTAAQGFVFAEAFDRAGIPYQVVSRETIFNTKGVSELVSLLKIVEGSGCLADLERIASLIEPAITKQAAEIFKHWCYQNNFSLDTALVNVRRFPVGGLSKARQTRLIDFFDSLEAFTKQTQAMTVEKKLIFLTENSKLANMRPRNPKTQEALNRLIEISQTCNNIFEFLAETALQGDTDAYVPQAEKVALMTMHASKGLEFPVVFIAGCEEGFLPFQRSATEKADIDEERRLFYVAMTRAKEQLYLTCAQKRRIYGKTEKRTLSPFVGEIEERLRSHEASTPKRSSSQGSRQLKLF